jgi:hypothetical protein
MPGSRSRNGHITIEPQGLTDPAPSGMNGYEYVRQVSDHARRRNACGTSDRHDCPVPSLCNLDNDIPQSVSRCMGKHQAIGTDSIDVSVPVIGNDVRHPIRADAKVGLKCLVRRIRMARVGLTMLEALEEMSKLTDAFWSTSARRRPVTCQCLDVAHADGGRTDEVLRSEPPRVSC